MPAIALLETVCIFCRTNLVLPCTLRLLYCWLLDSVTNGVALKLWMLSLSQKPFAYAVGLDFMLPCMLHLFFFAGSQRFHSWVACRVALTAPTLALMDFVTDWVFEKLRLLLLSLFCS